MFPWAFGKQPTPPTPKDLLLKRLREGVPPEDAALAAGMQWDAIKDDAEMTMAAAEGRIALFEQARDGGVSGTVRAAMRYETKTWTPKVEANLGLSLEDYLKP